MEHQYFDCQCGDFNHVFRFVLDEVDGEVWLEININPYLPWYKRVWEAVRYVFGCRPVYGHYDVTLLREEDYHRVHDLLDRSAFIKRQKTLKGLQEKPLLKG